jgi:hypothetical protein
MARGKHALKLSTLENPLLFRHFLTSVNHLNPGLEIDPEVIDRTLEYDEALGALQRIYPGLRTSKHEENVLEQFRHYLMEFGIDEKRIQNLIIQDDNPFSEDELGQLSYALHGRPERAVRIDRSLLAPITRNLRKWVQKPNRNDLEGIDTPQTAQKELAREIEHYLNSGHELGRIHTFLRKKKRWSDRQIAAAIIKARDAGLFKLDF